MADKPEKYVPDPGDGMAAEVVGEWVVKEKHPRLVKYISASSSARKKFGAPGKATFIDLYCGPGRVTIRGTDVFEDGGVISACKKARESGAPFSVVHIGDADSELLETCAGRLRKMGENVVAHLGPAEKTVHEVVAQLDPYGLHLAFLDPYNLVTLPFSIIETLSTIKRMDMIIHVSAQDLQRNIEKFIKAETSPLDEFAPGWRNALKNPTMPNHAMRADVLEYWLGMVRDRDMKPSEAFALITGSKNQRLYWLVFASRHKLPDKLWGDVQNLNKQGVLF